VGAPTPGRSHAVAWRDALRDSDLDVTAKAVGFVMSTYLPNVFPSRATIAAGASLSVRAVDKALKRLEAGGFITTRRTRGRNVNSYLLTIPNGERGSLLPDSQRRTKSTPTANRTTSNGEPRSPEDDNKSSKTYGGAPLGGAPPVEQARTTDVDWMAKDVTEHNAEAYA
jgi:hypothetical protein